MRATREEIITFLREIKVQLVDAGIAQVALFGSYARDEAGVYSDIDIAIAKEKDYLQTRTAYDYFQEVAKLKEQLREKFQKNSDIFDLDSDSFMKHSIMRDLIYV